jgi:hypothetical protein
MNQRASRGDAIGHRQVMRELHFLLLDATESQQRSRVFGPRDSE